jgi:hypothetical protein
MAEINLPLEPRPPQILAPNRLVLFSKPKVGKTTLVSTLPKNLILDFEKGTLAVAAMAVQVKSYQDIDAICAAIQKAGYPYQYITIDTASSLEEMCMLQAEINYANSPEGEKWFLQNPDGTLHERSGKLQYANILNLPYGKGYQYLAEAYEAAIKKLERCAPRLIILAHSTTTTVTKDGVESVSLDLQLNKKPKFYTLYKADAVGYIYRKGTQNFINFTATEDVGAGGRFRNLEKEHILISEYDEQDNLVTYWESIFPTKKK